MPTNPYFRHFDFVPEQDLVQDLVTEAIQIYGHDLFYLPREANNLDTLFGEDPLSRFEEAIPIEMYVKSVDGFTGDGDILSRVGMFIKDEVTFTVSRSVWEGLLDAPMRPLEGDLIYFPMVEKMFKIKFIEHEDVFYQTGALQSYDLICEVWDYSSEVLATANTDLNANLNFLSLDMIANTALNVTTITEIEPTADNTLLEIDTDDYIDDTERSPFS